MSKPVVRRVDPADWPSFAAGFRDLTYEQSLAWSGPAAARLGAEAQFWALERAGRPMAGAVARVKRVPGLGRGIAWIASGPVALALDGAEPSDDDMIEILAALRAELCGRQGHILRLRPPPLLMRSSESWTRIVAAAGFGPSSRAASYQSFALDLSQEEDALMKGLNGKWRGHLRNALKAGMHVERGLAEERGLAARFRALYDEVRDAKGFETGISPEFFFTLEGSDFTHDVLMATKDGKDVAGIVVGATGPTAVYLFGATGLEGRRLRAGYLLTWEGIRLARAQGRRWYDLGGVDELANPDVYHFKLRTGGIPFDAPGPFEARPSGPLPRLIEALEALRARMKGRR